MYEILRHFYYRQSDSLPAVKKNEVLVLKIYKKKKNTENLPKLSLRNISLCFKITNHAVEKAAQTANSTACPHRMNEVMIKDFL